jgi:hypothetical protein
VHCQDHRTNTSISRREKEEKLTQMTKIQSKDKMQVIESDQSLIPKDIGNDSKQQSKNG